MPQALHVRATSIGASTLIVGGLVVAAMTITSQVMTFQTPPAPGPFEMFRPPEPTPPPPTPVRRIEPPTDEPLIVDTSPLPPLDTFEEVASIDARPRLATGPVQITQPVWTRRPENLARYYPRRALERGVEGVVMLDCLVSVDGSLSCATVSETPSGWGFADAAHRMAREHRMAPATRDGAAVEGRYRMRVPFDLN